MLILGGTVSAQDPVQVDTTAAIRFSGYGEVYYSFDLGQPPNNERPEFLYNHKRHNEVTANLLLVKGEYERDGVRGAVGLMAGTYPQYNLAHEPDMLGNVYEARVGMRLSKRRELWVDAGIFPSHIGFETVIGVDCQTLTRSILAENSPYYEAGVMVSYQPNDRWLLAGLVLNGWQRIERELGNTRPAFGTQLKYDNGEGTVLNWSSFHGWMGFDEDDIWRFYNNFYSTFTGSPSSMTIGFDFGLQKGALIGTRRLDLQGWFTGVLILRQRLFREWWLAFRGEYFIDDGVMIGHNALLGGSLGVDHGISDRTAWRIEVRGFRSTERSFLSAEQLPIKDNLALTTALCLKL
jgi:hypothetical protein